MADTITQIINVDPRILKVHPRNTEFFDDVEGAEFDRLVESIKDHGVLTPLRVTKDMTIISGHQRTRAAIKAECFSVPVIVDGSEDDNDVLMKLIETNFGRMKNDPIKQAKWLDEYLKLRGVRVGQGKGQSRVHNAPGATQEDIAAELGVEVSAVKRLKSLLKLDPAFQALISEGKINATTGFKILSKLSTEEQTKLLEKLPTDVKLSAKDVQAHIDAMRTELTDNTAKVQQESDKLRGQIDFLRRENNELRSGKQIESPELQEKLDRLETERRDYYEKYQAAEKGKETLRGMLKEYNDEIVRLKAVAEGGDEGVLTLQNEIDELNKKLAESERKSNDLEFQLSEKEDEIKELEREKKDGVMRKALSPKLGSKEFSERQRDALMSDIAGTVGAFTGAVRGILMESDSFVNIDKEILRSLVEMTSDCVSVSRQLMTALMAAGGAGGNDIDGDDDGDDDLDLSLGA